MKLWLFENYGPLCQFWLGIVIVGTIILIAIGLEGNHTNWWGHANKRIHRYIDHNGKWVEKEIKN